MKQGDHEAITEVERQTWNRSAAIYLEYAAKITDTALSILLEACRLTHGSRALDAACGPGHVANMMAQTGACVTGVDLAPEMIKLAEELYPSVTFREANVEQLPFEDSTFDVALINYGIHHFARPDVACAEIRRVLKQEGRFVFAAPKDQHGFGAFIEAINAHHTLDDLPHGPIYLDADQATYEKLLSDSGFEQFSVELHQLPLKLDSLEPILVCGWSICDLDDLPQTTQDKISASTQEKAAPFKTADGYCFPDTVFVGVALKS